MLEIPTCCANFGMDFVGVHSRLAPISSNVSSVKTVRLQFCLPHVGGRYNTADCTPLAHVHA